MPARYGVAIVDDEADVIKTYRRIFERRGIPVAFTALDGPEALDKLKAADPKPEVVIIDYRLPSVDGLELMKDVLALDPGTRIIVISGDDSAELGSLRAGAAAFLLKPAGIKAIIEAVRRLLAS